MRNPFDGFTDPARRPRYILTAGVVVLLLVPLVMTALAVASSRWFCANACHKVQDDTIVAYNHSSHDKVSCIACHVPAGAGPVTFLIDKSKKVGELYLTVTDRYSLPLNPESELAQSEEMPSKQCTQCHSGKRRVTPSRGVIIDHDAHAKKGITCAMCHNRVAHREDFTLKLPGNRKHEDFASMAGCVRCHGRGTGSKAPGACPTCHPKGFELRPLSHLVPGFYTKGGIGPASRGHADLKKERPEYCKMCHDEPAFCTACHGLLMPHPEGFTRGHGTLGKTRTDVCLRCHGTVAGGKEFCNACHHKQADPRYPWLPQHPGIVRQTGTEPCFACHKPPYCAHCHVRRIQ